MNDVTRTGLPAPLTHASCDLRDFPFMPLVVAQFRDSDLVADETPEVCWAAMLIQAASWHQLPAGSIPDDDNWIAKVANYRMRGKTDRAWNRVRQGALRGWIKCSDGRLYHPDVARKVSDAWDSKLKQRYRSECARLAKLDPPAARPDYDQWFQDGCPVGKNGDKLLISKEFQGVYPKDIKETKLAYPKDEQETQTLLPLDVQEIVEVEVEVEVEEIVEEIVEEKENICTTGTSPVVPRAQAHATPPPGRPVDNSSPVQTAPEIAVQPADNPPALAEPSTPPPAEPDKNPPGQSGKRASGDMRASRLPESWQLPKEWCDWAMGERHDLSADDVRREAACFADYWHAKAGVDARKLDWQATWRNWIRRAHGKPVRGSPPYAVAHTRASQHSNPSSAVASLVRPASAQAFEIARQQLFGEVIDAAI